MFILNKHCVFIIYYDLLFGYRSLVEVVIQLITFIPVRLVKRPFTFQICNVCREECLCITCIMRKECIKMNLKIKGKRCGCWGWKG